MPFCPQTGSEHSDGTKKENTDQPNSSEDSQEFCSWYDPSVIPQRTTLKGHVTSVVTCMQFEDDYVITGSDDKIIRIYDAKKKQFLLELKGHDGGVWALKYDEDGILVSGSTDRTVRIWDINRGCCTHVFKGHTFTVRCLDTVEHRGVKYIVTGSRDHTLRVWRFPRDKLAPGEVYPIVHNSAEENPYFVGVLRGHTDSVRNVSGHGHIVVSGAYDGKVIVWDIAQMLCLYILTGHTDRIYSTIYDYKHNRCISGSMDTNVGVWDLNNIRKSDTCSEAPHSQMPCTKVSGSLLVLLSHTALVGLLKLSEKYLVSGSADGSLRCWDSNDYSLRFCFHNSNNTITALDLNGDLLVSGCENECRIYNLRSGTVVHPNILPDAECVWWVKLKGPILVAAVEKNRKSYIEILDFSKPVQSEPTIN